MIGWLIDLCWARKNAAELQHLDEVQEALRLESVRLDERMAESFGQNWRALRDERIKRLLGQNFTATFK